MNQRPLLLDLFCGAGGAAMGYYRAGFDIVGVDINPQPNYPFDFIQGDAIEYLKGEIDLLWLGQPYGPYATIHASPPCQRYTALAKGNNANAHEYPDLVEPVRGLLDETGLPYVIENVPGAPIRDDVALCGLMFRLRVFRHRRFELGGWKLDDTPDHPPHKGHRVAGWRHGEKHEGDMVAVYGDGGGKGSIVEWQEAMGIDWTDVRVEIAEAIPPAYTEYIGKGLIEKGFTKT